MSLKLQRSLLYTFSPFLLLFHLFSLSRSFPSLFFSHLKFLHFFFLHWDKGRTSSPKVGTGKVEFCLQTEEMYMPTPPDLSQEHFRIFSSVEKSKLPLSQLGLVISSYYKTVGKLCSCLMSSVMWLGDFTCFWNVLLEVGWKNLNKDYSLAPYKQYIVVWEKMFPVLLLPN